VVNWIILIGERAVKSVLMVRHGKASLEGDDLNRGLTEDGEIQAIQLASILNEQKTRPSIIYSSPYQRAILSIKPFAESVGLEIKTNMDLREKKIATGPIEDIVEVRQKMWADLNYRHSGGETGLEVQERGMNAINSILQEINLGETALIASHGNFIGLIINLFQSDFRYDQWKNMSMPDIYRIDFIEENNTVVEHIGVEGVSTFKIQ